MGQAGPGPEGGPGRRAVEAATAVIVAVIVASGVVAVGVATRGEPQDTADGGPDDATSGEPEATAEATPDSEDGAEASDEPTGEPTDEADEETTEEAEVTDVVLEVDQHEYTGRCPVTLTFSARVSTNTGPVRVDVEWRDADSNEVEGEWVQFGGPGPQGVTISHQAEVHDDATIARTLAAIDPNEVASNTVEATVTCTPYAEITKGGATFDAEACDHIMQFDATITVPHDMTIEYTWERTDGATNGPHTVEFNSGGMQTQAIPGQPWTLEGTGRTGEYGYQLHITSPYDVLSDPVTYDVDGCSGPAS